mgnify:CR=1 FL=1
MIRNYNFRLVIFVTALTMLGISVIGSAQRSVQSKQVLGLVLGLIVMIIVSLIDYSFILRFSWLIYLFNIGLSERQARLLLFYNLIHLKTRVQ